MTNYKKYFCYNTEKNDPLRTYAPKILGIYFMRNSTSSLVYSAIAGVLDFGFQIVSVGTLGFSSEKNKIVTPLGNGF